METALEGITFSFSQGSLASVKPVSSLMIAIRGSQENCWYCVPNCSTCGAEAVNQYCQVCLSLSQAFRTAQIVLQQQQILYDHKPAAITRCCRGLAYLGFTVVLPLVADHVERAAGLHRLQLVMRIVHQEERGQCLG